MFYLSGGEECRGPGRKETSAQEQRAANTHRAGNQAFTFNGTTAKANAVWFADIGSDLVLRGDINGDGRADFEIQLTGINQIRAGDFLL